MAMVVNNKYVVTQVGKQLKEASNKNLALGFRPINSVGDLAVSAGESEVQVYQWLVILAEAIIKKSLPGIAGKSPLEKAMACEHVVHGIAFVFAGLFVATQSAGRARTDRAVADKFSKLPKYTIKIKIEWVDKSVEMIEIQGIDLLVEVTKLGRKQGAEKIGAMMKNALRVQIAAVTYLLPGTFDGQHAEEINMYEICQNPKNHDIKLLTPGDDDVLCILVKTELAPNWDACGFGQTICAGLNLSRWVHFQCKKKIDDLNESFLNAIGDKARQEGIITFVNQQPQWIWVTEEPLTVCGPTCKFAAVSGHAVTGPHVAEVTYVSLPTEAVKKMMSEGKLLRISYNQASIDLATKKQLPMYKARIAIFKERAGVEVAISLIRDFVEKGHIAPIVEFAEVIKDLDEMAPSAVLTSLDTFKATIFGIIGKNRMDVNSWAILDSLAGINFEDTKAYDDWRKINETALYSEMTWDGHGKKEGTPAWKYVRKP